MEIFNLTQHQATQEQKEAGVYEPDNEIKEKIKELLTFDNLPTKAEIEEKARLLTGIAIAEGAEYVMIGGAPFLMPVLEKYLKIYDIIPLYAFSKRISEEKEINGKIQKVSYFKFEGFVEA